MPTTYNMKQGEDLYRGIFEYDYEPFEWVRDPVETRQFMVGPYKSITPIKAAVTRQRRYYPAARLVKVEKVSGWEEVEIV